MGIFMDALVKASYPRCPKCGGRTDYDSEATAKNVMQKYERIYGAKSVRATNSATMEILNGTQTPYYKCTKCGHSFRK